MSFTTYVLEDDSGRFYKGVTNDIDRRLREHLRGKTRTTSKMNGLRLVYSEEYATFKEARSREVYFKTSAGRRFLREVLE